ncbi:hypothetical protein QYF61_025658 [Mycteria americana]|uniref:Uncharacterized protein n=1 Tax=Mycteria americana TaxID=33587 RepID=A0AAN7SA72_MYCAM|nr:hypothetical protein QYF61_025658 [Mycteria americana]
MVGLDDLKGLFQPKQFYDSNYMKRSAYLSVFLAVERSFYCSLVFNALRSRQWYRHTLYGAGGKAWKSCC